MSCFCYENCEECNNRLHANKESVSIDETELFYQFLQGECPKCLHPQSQPKLDQETAFSVIYYLQEIMRVIPDYYERCTKCGELYDSEYEGSDGEFWDENLKEYVDEQPNRCDGCREWKSE